MKTFTNADRMVIETLIKTAIGAAGARDFDGPYLEFFMNFGMTREEYAAKLLGNAGLSPEQAVACADMAEQMDGAIMACPIDSGCQATPHRDLIVRAVKPNRGELTLWVFRLN